ncbi:MAG: DUF4129 domain-containing protein [Acidobacteriota bacterium]|nr:DUF4129 domain-containing protein [Acidobacteriota bacterium]
MRTELFSKYLFSAARLAVFLAAFFLFSTVSVWAIPLEQYRENVSAAINQLNSLQFPRADLTAAQLVETERPLLKEIRRLVPPTEKVELANGAIEINNAWLEQDLQTVESLTAKGENRMQFLRQTTDKLGAIRDRLDELLLAAQSVDRSKNQNKQKLDEILRRPEFLKPEEKEKSVLERWIAAFEKWLQDLFRRNDPNIAPSDIPNLSALGTVLSYLVIGLAILIIAFVVYRFLLPLMGREARLKITKNKEPRIVLGERIGADESAADLIAEAENLARAGDVRSAIRKGYIALLCELSDRKILGLARHKTNRDYLHDLKKRPEIFQNVRAVTSSFERHWYGLAPADERDWQSFRGNYEEALKQK